MKQLFILALCMCIAPTLYAQKAPDAFWGIGFNSKRLPTIRHMKLKTKIIPVEKPGGYLVFEDVYDFEGYPARNVSFRFRNDSMISGEITYRSTATSSIFTMYDDLVEKYTARYGKPGYTTFENMSAKEEEIKEIAFDMVREGNMTLLTGWAFEKENKIVLLTLTREAEIHVYTGELTPEKMDIMTGAAAHIAELDKTPKKAAREKPAATTAASRKATGIEGFWGLKFGITQTAAKNQVLNTKKIKPAYEKSGTIMYYDVLFGDDLAETIMLTFDDGMLTEGTITIKADAATVLRKYRNLVSTLEEKYGQPQTRKWEFKWPYDEEGKEILALQTGYATIVTIWMDSNGNSVGIVASKDLSVNIFYQTAKTDRQKARIMNDY